MDCVFVNDTNARYSLVDRYNRIHHPSEIVLWILFATKHVRVDTDRAVET
jgi:hypothetical protein